MDSHPSVFAVPPESVKPLILPSQSVALATIDPLSPPANSVEVHSVAFMSAGDNSEDASKKNHPKIRPFGARGRHGMRWGVGYGGELHHHPCPINNGGIHCHGSDAQHGKSALVESYEPQSVAPEAVPKTNLTTTGEEAMALQPPSLKTCLLPQAPLVSLTWCDVCRVDCNSLKILEKHRTGKRHKRTVQLLEKMEGLPEIVQEIAINNHMKPNEVMKFEGSIETSKINCDASANPKKKRKKNAAPEQPRICILCDAVCNGQATFASHLAGKKHTSRISRFQRPDTIYGLMSSYTPPNQSSASASQDDAQPLYYGLMYCEQPQACAVLNPHLEQAYDLKEHLLPLDSEDQ